MKKIFVVIMLLVGTGVFAERTWLYPPSVESNDGVYIDKLYFCIGNYDGQTNYVWFRIGGGNCFLYRCTQQYGELSSNDRTIITVLTTAFVGHYKVNFVYDTNSHAVDYIVIIQ
jgi:hypothetical protein